MSPHRQSAGACAQRSVHIIESDLIRLRTKEGMRVAKARRFGGQRVHDQLVHRTIKRAVEQIVQQIFLRPFLADGGLVNVAAVVLLR